jgi:hypothetical protein
LQAFHKHLHAFHTHFTSSSHAFYKHINGFMVFVTIFPLIYVHASRGTGCLSNRARSALCHTIRAWSQVKLDVNWWKIQAIQSGSCFPTTFRLRRKKCKSEDPGPWRRPGLGREWDPSVAHFSMKMLISHCFYKVLTIPPRNSANACFPCVLMIFDGECANVHADTEDYCESLDMHVTVHSFAKGMLWANCAFANLFLGHLSLSRSCFWAILLSTTFAFVGEREFLGSGGAVSELCCAKYLPCGAGLCAAIHRGGLPLVQGHVMS